MANDINSINATLVRPSNNNAATKSDQNTQAAATETTKVSKDTVEVSAGAKQIQDIQELVGKLPEVDLDRIQQIKAAIADGSYEIDSKNIAEKLIELNNEG